MALFFVIDDVQLKAVRKTTDYELALTHGHFLCKGNYTVIAEGRNLSAYGIGQLCDIFKNMSGKKLPIVNGFAEGRQLAWEAVQEYTPDAGPSLAELRKKYGPRPAIDPKPTFDRGVKPVNPEKDPEAKAAVEKMRSAPKADKAPRAAVSGGVAPTRPRAGTTTARVWDIADNAVTTGVEGKALRAAIVAACVAEGIDPSTAATQYSKWNRARVAL